jgi:hypothetical protein
MANIYVQFQNISGWNTVTIMDATSSSPQVILMEMQSVKRMMQGARVRTVDENDRLIDMLP